MNPATCVLVNNNLSRKLVSSLESPSKSLTGIVFIPDFNLLKVHSQA